MLWKIKRMAIALEAPDVFDPDEFVGRYVIGIMGTNEYNGKTRYEVKEWKYAKQNDKLPPIPSAAEDDLIEVDEDGDVVPF